jgi:alpha-L-fucosidase
VNGTVWLRPASNLLSKAFDAIKSLSVVPESAKKWLAGQFHLIKRLEPKSLHNAKQGRPVTRFAKKFKKELRYVLLIFSGL